MEKKTTMPPSAVARTAPCSAPGTSAHQAAVARRGQAQAAGRAGRAEDGDRRAVPGAVHDPLGGGRRTADVQHRQRDLLRHVVGEDGGDRAGAGRAWWAGQRTGALSPAGC
ncbi:hypothetical protein [Modestobacter sp. SYSU DS0875]